ncbi:uncharacterized protein LOC135397559 isoform X2 [Ornithodoros turicata]|uniref:uncharacterized protein LOC135397559 isoform X2 n=1 Tax=Ornithodoros turicata TaxID=34597 RepID=UPI00313A2820
MKVTVFFALSCIAEIPLGLNDIIPKDYDDITDAETVRVLAHSGYRSPFVSRGRAFLDKYQKILTNTDIARESEEKLLKSEAWKDLPGMARLRRLHIVRQNAKTRYLKFGKSFCLHVKKLAPALTAKMLNMTDKQRSQATANIIKLFESELSKSRVGRASASSKLPKAKSGATKKGTESGRGDALPLSSFISASRELESLRSSLHDFIIFKCAIEKDIMDLIEEYMKTIYFGDYRKLFAMVEKLLLNG